MHSPAAASERPHFAGRLSRAAATAGATLMLGAGLAGCSTAVFALTEGDCFDLPDEAELTSSTDPLITLVDEKSCTSAHDAQVVGIRTLPGGDFPGEDELLSQADTFCEAQFESFIGVKRSASALEMLSLLPTADSWELAEDRSIVCVAYSTDGDVTESWEKGAK